MVFGLAFVYCTLFVSNFYVFWLASFILVLVESLTVDNVIAEVITSAEFHPTHCNTLAYSSSKGSIRLVDLRQSALCDSHAKL
jgi:serine/threonine-protein phosphatase 2A regulatory subunit B